VRRGLVTTAAVAAVLAAALVTAALLLPDVGGEPRLVPAPQGDEPPAADAAAAVTALCREHRPAPAPPGIQSSAPRSAVAPGGVVELGLRDRTGVGVQPVTAEVTAPGGSRAAAGGVVNGSVWTYLDYPDDFAGATGTERAGAYRVRWRDADGTALACDGFVVAKAQGST
jgi:hypothetical protein